jgi:capsular polysaccharide biosynthesis protein
VHLDPNSLAANRWIQALPEVLVSPGKIVASAISNHYRAIATITLIFLVAAAVASFVRPPTYDATALLTIDERQASGNGFDASLTQSQVVGQQYISLATSRSLAVKVCQGVSRQVACDPDTLQHNTSATMQKGTTQIALTVASGTPDGAALLANAVASEVVTEVQAQAADLVKPELDLLNQQLSQINDQIDAEKSAISRIPTAGRPAADVQRDQATHDAHIAQLQQEYSATFQRIQDNQIKVKSLGSDLSVTQKANPPVKPADPDPVRYLLVALGAGLFVGFLVALMRERLDHSLRRGQSLAEAAGLTLVIDEGDAPPRGDSHDPQADLARASLLSRYPGAQKIMMVGVGRDDDAGDAASGLARAAASFGHHVLVLETDSHHGSANGGSARARRRFKSGNGTITLASVSATELASTIDSGDGEYDLTVLSLPSPMTNPTAVLMAARTDVIVLVATAGRTSFEDAREAADLLRRSGVEVGAGILVADGVRRDLISAPA